MGSMSEDKPARKMSTANIAAGVALLAVLAALVRMVQEIPVHKSSELQEESSVYNIVELSAPVVTGPLAKFLAYILAKSWLSPFLMRHLLNENGFALLRQMAVDHCSHLPATHFPLHPLSQSEIQQTREWAEESKSIQQSGLDFKLDSPPPYCSIMDYHRLYQSKRATPSEVMENWLQGAESLSHLRIFAYLDPDQVRQQAEASTKRWQSEEGPLSVWDGVPVAVKDMTKVAGMPMCEGSLKCSPPSEEDDYPVARLREAGAIVVGMTVMTEGGVTPLGYSAFFDGPFNPYNTEYYPGGSSGGSAVAVATGLVPIALGWDGGGSVRIPSAMSGVLGLATTHGRIPFWTRVAQMSVTTSGPIAATYEDLALAHMLVSQVAEDSHAAKVFHGADQIPPPHLHSLLQSQDEASDEVELPIFDKVRVGVFWDHFKDTTPEVYGACLEAVKAIELGGGNIVNITIPHLREIHLSHGATIISEFAMLWENRFFDPDDEIEANTAITLAMGRATTATELLAAKKIRTWALDYVLGLYKSEHLDAIISPMLGTTVPKPRPGYRGYGESNTPLVYKVMRFTPLVNFLGLPGLVLNAGYEAATSLPIGLQLMGAPWSESTLMKIGSKLQGLLPPRKRPTEFYDVLAKWQ